MNRSVILRGPGGEQTLDTGLFPIAVSGDGRMGPVNRDHGATDTSCFIGWSEGQAFVQPGPGGAGLRLNDRAVRDSQWLHDGDILRCGEVRLTCSLHSDSLLFTYSVHATDGETDTLPPLVIAPPATSAPVERIEPVAFTPSRLESRRERGLRPAGIVLTLAFLLLVGVGWYVLSARSVAIEVEPTPDQVAIAGTPSLALAGRYLLRPGRYVVSIRKEGYGPLETPIEVSSAPRQDFAFRLEKLPGFLAVHTGDVSGVTVQINGESKGETPLPPIELPDGTHEITLSNERYQTHVAQVDIQGMGIIQELGVTMVPAWAPVRISSTPPGAMVRIGDRNLGPTPQTVDLLEGAYELELHLPAHETARQHIQVLANEPLEVPHITLLEANALLVLGSEPEAVTVSVDGKFVGQTPLRLPLSPGSEHLVQASRSGYRPVSRSLTLDPAEERALTLKLTPNLGTLRIESRPTDAEVWIDGRRRGQTPLELQLAAHAHRVEVRSAGRATFKTSVTPRAGLTEVLTATLNKHPITTPPATPVTLTTRDGQSLRLIPDGSFTMGASRREQGRRSNETLRRVRLTRPFYIGTREVTNAQYRAFDPGHDSGDFQGIGLNGADQPVVNVTWEEAVLYCNWLSEQEKLPAVYVRNGDRWVARRPMAGGYRLPTEAEWAWAARFLGGKGSLRYPWGNGYPPETRSGNFADASAASLFQNTVRGYQDGFAASAPVGRFPANDLGVFDLGGNVAEWTHDVYAVYPGGESEVITDPQGPGRGRHHVIRGASWQHAGISALRLARRDYGDGARPDLGFRIARSAPGFGATAMHQPSPGSP